MAVSEYIRELSGKSDMIKVLNICFNNYQFLKIECPPPKKKQEKKKKKSLLSQNCNVTMKSKMQNLIFIIVLNYNGWLVEFTAL